MLPQATFTSAAAYNDLIENAFTSEAYALLNPNPTTVTITFQGVDQSPLNLLGLATLAIPPNTLNFVNMNAIIQALGLDGFLWIRTSAPILGLVYRRLNEPDPAPDIQTTVTPFAPVTGQGLQVLVSPPTVSWSWQQGTALPAAATASVFSGSLGFQTAVSATWLKVTPTNGTGTVTLTLTASPSSLQPGNYSATVTITPILPPTLAGLATQASTIAVSLTVSSVR